MNTATKTGAAKAILVLGMHRSGTSAVTRVLNLLGVDLGGELMAPAEGNNPLGFWEHQKVVDIHDALLTALGRSWSDIRALPEGWLESEAAGVACEQLVEVLAAEFSESPLWAVKDPRLCRLLPLWKMVLARLNVSMHALLVLRHPDEVAESLRTRDGLPMVQTRLSWLEHMAEAELDSRQLPRVVISYDQLLDDWSACMERVARELELSWPLHIERVRADVADFLSRGERHHQVSLPIGSRDGATPELIDAMYAGLRMASLGGGWAALEDAVQSYRMCRHAFLDVIEQDRRELTELREKSTQQAESIVQLEGRVNRLVASTQELSAYALMYREPLLGADGLHDAAKLYFRADGQHYDESRTVTIVRNGNYETQSLRFELPLGANFEYIRFDPSEYSGTYEVWGLRINRAPVENCAERVLACRQAALSSADNQRFRFAAFDGDPYVDFDIHDLVPAVGTAAIVEFRCRRLGLRDQLVEPVEAKLSEHMQGIQSLLDRVEARIVALDDRVGGLPGSGTQPAQ